VIVKDPTTP